MDKFLAWEKAILVYSSILAVILTLVGAVLFPTLGPSMNIDIPKLPEILKLGLSGWIGFVGIGTVVNVIGLALRIVGKKN